MRKRILIIVSLILVFATAIVFDSAQYTSAKDISYEGKNQTICHFDNNVNQPYGPKAITVDVNSIIKDSGHSDHTGPLVTSLEQAQYNKDHHIKWGDIIPAFDYLYTDNSGIHNLNYTGLNNSVIGLAMITNNCKYVSKVIPTAVTFKNATCDIKEGSYTIPKTDHVAYYINDKVVASGTYKVITDATVTITAKADKGYYIAGETIQTWTHKFHIPTAEECVLGAESVTPTPVVFTAPTCDALGYYTVPTTNGIKYYIGDNVVTAGKHTAANGTTVTIKAIANDGFEIKTGATSQWSYTFTARTDCVLGASTTAAILPTTSGDMTASSAIIVSLLATIAAVLGAFARGLLIRRY